MEPDPAVQSNYEGVLCWAWEAALLSHSSVLEPRCNENLGPLHYREGERAEGGKSCSSQRLQ